MRRLAIALAIGLATAGCSDSAEVESVSTIATDATEPDVDELTSEEKEAARVEALAEWVDRPVEQILDEGFNTDDCVRGPPPEDVIVDYATLTNSSWAWVDLPLVVTAYDDASGFHRSAISLSGAEAHPLPYDDYTPTDVWLNDPDTPMASVLTDPSLAGIDAQVVLAYGPTSQGRDATEGVRLGFAAATWLVTDDAVIPFRGECHSITTFKAEFGEPLAGLATLRDDPFARAEFQGLAGDRFDFSRCHDVEPGITQRAGFGGADVGFAFGGEIQREDMERERVSLDGWTVVPPADETAPLSIGIKNAWSGGLSADGWFVTYSASHSGPRADLVFHVDPVIGLHAWYGIPEDDDCFGPRQVLAFREFLEGVDPNREAWQWPIGTSGDEALVADTLERLQADATAQAAFHEWTPCTYKLCVFDGVVEPRSP